MGVGGRNARAPQVWGCASQLQLVKAQVRAEGRGTAAQPGSPQPQPPLRGSPVPAVSSGQLNPPPSQEEVKNVTSQSGTLKFNGGDAYLMGLNKASLKTSQTAPRGQGQAAERVLPGSRLLPSSVCGGGRGTSWPSTLLPEPSAGLRAPSSCPFIINIRRVSEEQREQGPAQAAGPIPRSTPYLRRGRCALGPPVPLCPLIPHTWGHCGDWKVSWRRP